jgi:hypothetical protein
MKCKRCIHKTASILDNKVAICAPCWLELYGDEEESKDDKRLEGNDQD